DEFALLSANIEDRELLIQGKQLLQNADINADELNKTLGHLLYRHHSNLRDYKKTSTPKIERMMDAALAAGALGGKINGSGGGGCMFAYAPNNAEEVAEAIEKVGGKSHIIEIDEVTTWSNEPLRLKIFNRYGLIGYPLSHSFSKKYFSEKFQRENI